MWVMRRWPYTFVVFVSVAISVTAIVYSQTLDLPLRDPEGFLGPAYIRLPALGLLFFAAGIIPPAIKRYGVRRMFPGIKEIVREEWTWKRVVYIATGLLSFYACYVSYRNLKSFLPVIRKDVLFDVDLLRLDHWLMFGHNPASLLHDLLGTGIVADFLAFSYISYLTLVPISLGAVLVLDRNLSVGAWYATAVSLNWVLGVISYYALPTLGPAFAQPQSFADLPETGVTALQQSLFSHGVESKADPANGPIYGIAGFASLHVSVVVTAALFMSRTGQRAALQIFAWVVLGITVTATIYFGWHYIADDVAGAVIGWMSVSLGAWATGNRGRRRRRGLEEDLLPEPVAAGAQ
jgi:hypothetical protein